MIHPPSVGPMVGAMMAVMPYSANASPRFCGGNVSARMAWAIGWSPPPPAPCRTRKRISVPKLGAAPHSSELRVNRKMHSRKNRLRPKSVASHPLMGRTMAFETR